MTTTVNVAQYYPRIDALCRATGGRVSVSMELWFRENRDPVVEWSVYLVAGSTSTGSKAFEGPTLEAAVLAAEAACDLLEGDAPDEVIL
jgi:hypothetical protein